MRQPSAPVLEAIKRVAARPEGLQIREYLTGEMNNTMKLLIANNDPQLVRALQGEARVLDELLMVWKS